MSERLVAFFLFVFYSNVTAVLFKCVNCAYIIDCRYPSSPPPPKKKNKKRKTTTTTTTTTKEHNKNGLNPNIPKHPRFISGVASTRIAAHITHKNLAVCKNMDAMGTAYTRSGTRSQRVSNYTLRQTITEGTRVLWKESMHRMRAQPFILLRLFDEHGAFEMRHSFLYSALFVGEALPNSCTQKFPSTCVRCC